MTAELEAMVDRLAQENEHLRARAEKAEAELQTWRDGCVCTDKSKSGVFDRITEACFRYEWPDGRGHTLASYREAIRRMLEVEP